MNMFPGAVDTYDQLWYFKDDRIMRSVPVVLPELQPAQVIGP